MDYIESNLAKDEEVVERIRHSWAGLVPVGLRAIGLLCIGIVCFFVAPTIEMPDDIGVVLFNLLGAFAILIALYVFLMGYIEIKFAQLVVTNKRIFGRRGLIIKHTTDIMISKVDTLNVSNGFFGALFHYGSIQIVSAATGSTLAFVESTTLKYLFVSNTAQFRTAVLDTIEKSREEEREAQARALTDAMKNN